MSFLELITALFKRSITRSILVSNRAGSRNYVSRKSNCISYSSIIPFPSIRIYIVHRIVIAECIRRSAVVLVRERVGRSPSCERSRLASPCRWTCICSGRGLAGRRCRSCFRDSPSHAMCQWTRWRYCHLAGTFPIPPSDSGEQVTDSSWDCRLASRWRRR